MACFATRPVSLVATLLLAVVVSVISFGLLLFPAIAAFYYAVNQSQPEHFFIDLPNVSRTVGMFWMGLRRYFVGAFAVGLFGILPSIGLLLVPIVPLELELENAATWAVLLQVLLIPAFYFAGAVLLFAYPTLLVTGKGIRSLRQGLVMASGRPWITMAIGFVVLFPPVSFVFHGLMILTYPILVCAVAEPSDQSV